MRKIIGFLISPEKKRVDIDFFHVGLNILEIKHLNYFIYLWGIGNIELCKINGKYSLSFPLHDNLLDRNVLIYFERDKIIIENDWLGSIPIFYNPKERIVSTISNFCIKDKSIHPEGLFNFCEFGYSVFEQTFFQDVKFLRYYSKLLIFEDGISLKYKDDPVLMKNFFEKESSTDDVIQKMKEYINKVENAIDGDIILPTSGGYDSRMLNYLVENKKRIKSFTYGVSKDQSKSIEVAYAKKLSEILRTEWKQIELEAFHRYIDEWFFIYGISTHLHGMYHIEFYSKISKLNHFRNPTLLSGIFGDIWAGSVSYPDISDYHSIHHLGYAHGLNLDPKYLVFKEEKCPLKREFFERLENFLKDDRLKAVFTIRIKIILISYLTIIPEYFGWPVWTPFLNFEIAKLTLNLPEEQRKKRQWEKEFFRKVGLNLEDMKISFSRSNKLDYEVAWRSKLEPLAITLLGSFFSTQKMKKINKNLFKKNSIEHLKNMLLDIPKVGGVLRLLGIRNEFLKALYEYYVIKTVEKGLKYED